MTSDLAEQLPALEAEADEYERRAAALRQIIEAIRSLNGDAANSVLVPKVFAAHGKAFAVAPPDPEGPRGPRAVLEVMRGKPSNYEWKVVEVKREMLRRGWAPSPKAVEASIKRLRELREIVPVSFGYYRLAPGQNGSADNGEAGYPEA